MREIKFRVWWKSHSEPTIYTEYDFFDDTWTDAEYITVEQYTGLKDKNGKEIYEGDIIQEEIDFNSKMTDGIFRYRVYWNEEGLCWALEHIGEESIHSELWQCNLSTEVIGNIHENPELIEKEKE
jgi:uncharacterized phage protein (TIGR01671 family)